MSFHSPTERRRVAKEIADEAIVDVRNRYGSHAGAAPDGLWLPYHGANHAENVSNNAVLIGERLIEQGKLHPDDLDVLRVAGALHDCVQLRPGHGANERASAEIARGRMLQQSRQHVWRPHDVEHAEQAILATTVVFDEHGRLGQAVDEERDPRSVRVQQVMADADLSSIGSSDGLWQNICLFLEFEALKGRLTLPQTADELEHLEPDPQALQNWLNGNTYSSQDNFLMQHRFRFLSDTDQLFPHRLANGTIAMVFADMSRRGAPFAEILGEARQLTADHLHCIRMGGKGEAPEFFVREAHRIIGPRRGSSTAVEVADPPVSASTAVVTVDTVDERENSSSSASSAPTQHPQTSSSDAELPDETSPPAPTAASKPPALNPAEGSGGERTRRSSSTDVSPASGEDPPSRAPRSAVRRWRSEGPPDGFSRDWQRGGFAEPEPPENRRSPQVGPDTLG